MIPVAPPSGTGIAVPMRVGLMLLLAALTAGVADSQTADFGYTERYWGLEDGLPQIGVEAIRQTPDGYLWLGTSGGLVRFDGVRFETYSPSNTPALGTNRIDTLYVDRHGTLWIGGSGYLTWRTEDGFGSIETPRRQQCCTFFEDGEQLWVGSGNDLLRVVEIPRAGGLVLEEAATPEKATARTETSESNEQTLPYERIAEIPDQQHAFVLFRVGSGPLRVATGRGLLRLEENPEGGFRLVADPMLEGVAVEDPVVAVLSGDGDQLFVRTIRELLLLEDGAKRSLIRYGTNYSGPDSILRPSSGEVWLSTNEGLVTVSANPATAPRVQRIQEEFRDVASLFEDREGNLWMSQNGLARFTRKQVGTLFPRQPSPRGTQSAIVVLEASDGAMWTSFDCNVLERLDAAGSVVAFDEADRETCIWSLAEDTQGRIWAGTWGQGLHVRDDGRFLPYVIPGVVDADSVVLAIHFDPEGAQWLGMLEQLVRIAPDGSHRILTTADGLPHRDVRFLADARGGGIWMGTTYGFARFHDGRFEAYGTADGLSHGFVRAIHEDENGRVWVGTYGGGLNLFQGGRFFPFNGPDALPDDTVSRIFEDEQGTLWLSGNRGITAIERDALVAYAEGRIDRLSPAVYNEADGMASRETNGGSQPAGWQRSNGEMWFPTQRGVAVIDPKRLRPNQIAPPVHIQRIRVDGVESEPRGRVDLGIDPRNLEIEYTGLSFVDPENNQFRTRLLPVDEQWSEVGSRRVAYFTRLRPGNYRFEVVAANNDGVWSTEVAALELVVATPWWRTRWALLTALGLAICVVVIAFLLRGRSLRLAQERIERLLAERTAELQEKTERLAQLDATKSEFFANISHELRTPLTLAMVPLEELQGGVALPTEAQGSVDQALLNTRRLLRLVNQLLDVAKVEANQLELHLQEVDLAGLLDRLVQTFQPLAAKRAIHLSSRLPATGVPLYLDPDQTEKIFLNLLSNAFKFTPPGGTILVALEEDDAFVRASVRDSGPGIPADQLERIFDRFHQVGGAGSRLQPGTGIGLALASELAHLHGGRIEVRSSTRSHEGQGESATESTGATFVVTLAKGLDHLDAPYRIVDSTQAHPAHGPGDAALDALETTEGWSGPGLTEVREDAAPVAVGEDADDDRTTVLVVDDNTEMRALIRKQLEGQYRCREAANGTEALEQARELLPDVIVSDVMMPEMDGFELCRRVKGDPELGFIPVLLLTARATPEDRLEGLELGADAYLGKPFSPRELSIRVANLLANQLRLRRKLERELGPRALAVADLAAATSTTTELSATDRAWLERVEQAVEANLAEEGFNVDALAQALAVDRTQLFRRLKALTAQTPSAFLLDRRLARAAQLLETGSGTVGEVAYAVGFRSVSHFGSRFKSKFGATPAQFAESAQPVPR